MKNLSVKTVLLALIGFALFPAVSNAHTGLGALAGFGDGFAHPL